MRTNSYETVRYHCLLQSDESLLRRPLLSSLVMYIHTERRRSEASSTISLQHAFSAEIILRGVTLSLVQQVDASAQQHITAAGAFYHHSMRQGTKPIFHLEAFAARGMTVNKQLMHRAGI